MNFRSSIFILSTILFMLTSCSQDEKEINENKNEVKKEVQSTEVKIQNKVFSKIDVSSSGLDFVNVNKESAKYNYYTYDYFYNGGGVGVADFNNDGLQDVIFTANMQANRLFVNKGNLIFEDITDFSGITVDNTDWNQGLTIVDINNDGFQDILVCRSGWWEGEYTQKFRNLLFINNGDLTFTEKGIEHGFTDLSPTTQACFFDKDNDGDLDVYFLNHPITFSNTELNFLNFGLDKLPYFVSDKLYENKNGKFVDVTKQSGIKNFGHGLGVLASDLNNDGYQDIYIANDFGIHDHLYMNNGTGKFKDESLNAFKHISRSSMGVDVADINNDGLLDIFNTEMLAKDNYSKKTNMASMAPEAYIKFQEAGLHYQDMHNSLQLNNGNGTYSEIAWLSDIAETGWTWAPLFADFDNDGQKDLFVTNGYKRDVISKDFLKSVGGKFYKKKKEEKDISKIEHLIPSSKQPNYIYKNKGDLSFEDKTNEWGLGFAINSNGAAYADFDNDGDLDLVINNMNEQASLYKNNTNSSSNYYNINLKDGNKIPYGSRAEILDKGNYQLLELTNVHGYQSKCQDVLHFGLGKKGSIDSLLITWSGGKKTLMTNVAINTTQEIDKSTSSFTNYKKPNKNKQYFTDATKNIGLKYVHKEKDYDDYKREILLPHKLSQEGPFIAVADVNGDDLEDFYVGNGVGYAGELYLQTTSGKFKKSKQESFSKDYLSEDLGVAFLDYDQDGDQDLYVVSGSNESELNSEQMQDRLYENDGKGNFKKTEGVIPAINASGSCIVVADYDQDGDEDILVGGFQIPGQYPKAGKTSLLENREGKYVDVSKEKAAGLENIGMVKDAVFADVNKDGKLDIIVTGHWMPIEIYINQDNKFINKTKEYGLKNLVGWYNKLLVKDIDQDGYIDIVAGNLGTNTKHKASISEPFKIFADDFDGNGTNDIVLGYYNNGVCYPVRGKQCSQEQVPSINQKIPTYEQFGMANVFQVYGKESLDNSTHYDAMFFETAVFKNKGGKKFEAEKLENACQFAPTNGIVAVDIDGDTKKEIVMVGNHHPVEVETGRSDAHIGNVLKLENGKFKNQNQTGFFVDQDARCIKPIKIGNASYLIVSSNRNGLLFFKY